jgi:glycosyltransferase involved in cell wall biosynthesis
MLIFSGKMSYHANVATAMHLIADIMPLIWKRSPDVRLTIAGKDPPRVIKDVAARHPTRVTVTGTVPDMRPFLRQASISVVPLVYGAGSQSKVLEAMACATPVVASPQAVCSLKVQPGRDLLVGEDAANFADRVFDLLSDPRRGSEIGLAGRAYVEAHHRWDHIVGRLENVYEEAVAGRFPGAVGGSRLTA